MKTFSDCKASVLHSITISLIQAPVSIAMLALVFSGPLADYLGQATVYFILGTVIAMTITSYFSSWQGVVWIPQPIPIATLAIISSELTASLDVYLSGDTLFITMLATVVLASVSTGLALFLLGYFRLGYLIHLLPFPVIAGFLGGAGWLLLTASISTALGSSPTDGMLSVDTLPRWLPSVLIGLLAYIIERRINHSLLLPVMLFVAIGGFLGFSVVIGLTPAELRADGWLFEPLPPGGEFKLIAPEQLLAIQWTMIAGQFDNILVLVITSMIAMLLFHRGFQMSLHIDSDTNKDLCTHGIANICSGMLGGWPGYLSLALSGINARDGRRLPLTGLLSALLTGLILWYSAYALELLPRFAIGSAIAYIGFSFLYVWIIG